MVYYTPHITGRISSPIYPKQPGGPFFIAHLDFCWGPNNVPLCSHEAKKRSPRLTGLVQNGEVLGCYKIWDPIPLINGVIIPL